MNTPLGGVLPDDESDRIKVRVYDSWCLMIEAVVRGTNAKALAGAVAAKTLTVDEARNRIHIFTGAGAAIDIKYPLAGTATRFTVKNTSGFTLTIKTDAGGSTGVAVANNKVQELFINGNNVEAAAAAV